MAPRSRSLRAVAVLALLLPALLQAQAGPVTRGEVTITPGPQFTTTSWVRWLATPLFGSRNRALWNTPITLPELDAGATGGGLRRAGRGTIRDSGMVFLAGADGSSWIFVPLARSIPRVVQEAVLPAQIRDPILLDLVSARNPAGPLVAAALATAAGVPNQEAWLVVLPAQAGLVPDSGGAAGRTGYLLRGDPTPSADSVGPVAEGQVITSLALLHRLLTHPDERVDAVGVLQASLFNIFVGNLDPRFLDWRWQAARTAGGVHWRLLGTFRETALANYNGTVANLSRPLQPDLVSFGARYPHALAGFPDQASVYRFLLGGLGRATWDSVAAVLQASLTDSAIAAAVGVLPAPYRERDGERLARILRERRDRLPEAVARLYGAVRRNAELHGTTGAESVQLAWPHPDTLVVALGADRSTFVREETRTLTLFLCSGRDTLRLAAAAARGPSVRVVPGPGATLWVEGAPPQGKVTVYGQPGTDTLVPPTVLPIHPTVVADPLRHLDATGQIRSEGTKGLSPTTWFEISSGVGVAIGGGVVRTDWKGAARPYRNRQTLRAAYGTDANSMAVEYLGDFRWANSPLQLHVTAAASGIGAVYFYGFGNDTPGDSASGYYRAGRNWYGAQAKLVVPVSTAVEVGGGVQVARVNTPVDTALFIGIDQPYGTPGFGEAGLLGEVTLDTRDVKGAPAHGAFATLSGRWYPFIVDGTGAFGTVAGSLAVYHALAWWPRMTVAARVAGTATFGDVPYFQAASIGGSRTVRGLPQGRYEGNQAVYGNLDLRLRVSRVQFVLPWDLGLLALADVGRVFVTGESSSTWHPSFGGGVWVAVLDRSFVANLSVAGGGGQGTFLMAQGGFAF